MSRLKVTFEDPQIGGIWIHLQSATQSVSISATSIYNSFFTLVNALYRIYIAPGVESVGWMCEPVEVKLNRQEDTIHLDILWFLDSRRSDFNTLEPEPSVSDSYEEVCLPFWRALRALESRHFVDEFEAGWRNKFPTQELERVTQTLGK